MMILGIIIIVAILYVLMNHYTPHTSDGYVQAYVVQMAPLVSGRVTKIFVSDNSAVKAGNPLFELDARPYEYEMRQAEATLAIVRKDVAELKRDVTVSEARLTDNQALVKSAQTLFDEINKMRSKGAVSYVEYLTALDRLNNRKAAERESQAELEKANLALAAVVDHEHAMIRRAEAELAMAKWKLEQSRVAAPADGYVTNLQLQPGSSISANAPVMTFVDSSRSWVIANFNENTMARIKPGQAAEVSLRSRPGRVYTARVDSVGWGVERGQGMPSGRLPDPHTAQVWVRPPQRLPVKLVIEQARSPGDDPLPAAIDGRVGASVAVTIYTGQPNPINPLAALWQRVSTWLDYLY
jgi:multidrug resistance efflux pump